MKQDDDDGGKVAGQRVKYFFSPYLVYDIISWLVFNVSKYFASVVASPLLTN